MKIALLQVNPTVGDLAGNARLILDALRTASAAGADLAATPELRWSAICRATCCSAPASCSAAGTALEALARDAAACAGAGRPARAEPFRRRPSAVQQRGAAARRPRRTALPQGAAADLRRLRRGPLLRAVSRRATARHRRHAASDQHLRGHLERSRFLEAAALPSRSDRRARRRRRHLVLNMSASPFTAGKHSSARRDAGQRWPLKHRLPIAYVNQFGGNDDLVFDGRSMHLSIADGAVVARGRSFDADVVICDVADGAADRRRHGSRRRSRRSGARWCSAPRLRAQVWLSTARCSAFPAASTRR